MGDVGSMEVIAGVFGTVSVSFLCFLQVQALRGFWPSLSGRAAVGVVYAVAALTAAIVLTQAGIGLRDRDGLVAWYIGTLSVGLIAQGIYSQLFKISVDGAPPSPEASVPAAAINDPAATDDARPLTAAEWREVEARR